MELLKDEEMIKLLGLVHKTMLPYYEAYCDKKRLISFKKFAKFAADFGIFPDYLTKVKLHKFFHQLAAFYEAQIKAEH